MADAFLQSILAKGGAGVTLFASTNQGYGSATYVNITEPPNTGTYICAMSGVLDSSTKSSGHAVWVKKDGVKTKLWSGTAGGMYSFGPVWNTGQIVDNGNQYVSIAASIVKVG